MKFYVCIFFFFFANAFAGPAEVCDADACKIENNCRCSSASSPLEGNLDEWPQLISLTFDDAITQRVYDDYIGPLMSRTNPDDNPIGATFFVPHEYTDYQRVNDLYNVGFEIGVHSITKEPLQKYWREASEDTLVQEFSGQKQIISKFAGIPKEAILGVRTPQLQLAGNISIQAYQIAELTYDSSWPSLPTKRMFPYTLDYLSTEQCLLGAECPNEAFPSFWVLPINDLTGEGGKGCNALASCNINGTVDEISSWLTDQVQGVRNSTKVPLTLMLAAGWFNSTENSQAAFEKFLDNLSAMGDVFLVNQRQVLDYMKNPVKISDFQTEGLPEEPANCDPTNCRLSKGENDDRNFNICVSCPDVYPWLGNPDGNKQ